MSFQLLHRKHPFRFFLLCPKQTQSHVRFQNLRHPSSQPHLDPLHIHRQNPTLPRGHSPPHSPHHFIKCLDQRRRFSKLVMCRSHCQHCQQHRRGMTHRCNSDAHRRVLHSPHQKVATSPNTQRRQFLPSAAIMLQYYDTHVNEAADAVGRYTQPHLRFSRQLSAYLPRFTFPCKYRGYRIQKTVARASPCRHFFPPRYRRHNSRHFRQPQIHSIDQLSRGIFVWRQKQFRHLVTSLRQLRQFRGSFEQNGISETLQ